MGVWISVEDEWPELFKEVLLYDARHENIELGFRRENDWLYAWSGYGIPLAEVTHWMFLPPPPEKQKELVNE